MGGLGLDEGEHGELELLNQGSVLVVSFDTEFEDTIFFLRSPKLPLYPTL